MTTAFRPCLVLLAALAASQAASACPDLTRAAAADLTLAGALSRVALCSPDVRAADQALAAAAADLITAGEGQNPNLTLGAGTISNQGFGRGNLWRKTFDHSARIDQVIERGNKPALRKAAAGFLLQAARADRADALRQARSDAAHAYFDLSAALQRRTETAAQVDLNDQTLKNLDRRVTAGDAPALDAVRFNLDAIRARADEHQAEADTRALRLQLATAIGAEAVAEALTPSATTPPVSDMAVQPAGAGGVDRRPDVVAARLLVDGAQQAYELAQAARKRDVTVGVQLDHYPQSEANTSGTGNSVSLSVSVPLFIRHDYGGEIARAEADLRAAQEAFRKTALGADSDLARAKSALTAAELRRQLAVEQLSPAAEKVAAGAELAYRRGASGILDVLDARRSLRAARIERIVAESDLLKAQADLEAASLTLDQLSAP